MPSLTLRLNDKQWVLTFQEGPSLRDILNTSDTRIRSACRGNGACGLCRVRVESGEIPPPNLAETLHLELEQLEAGERLACQIRPKTDLSVTLLNPAPPSIWRSLPDSDYSSPFLAAGHRTGQARFGVAVDLGTTHISLAVCDIRNGRRLAMRCGPNPQAAEGSDILNRLIVAAESEVLAQRLTTLVVDAIGDGLLDISSREGISLHDVGRVAIVGNTAMLTLLVGEDPQPLLDPARWTAPFSCKPKDQDAWCIAWNLLSGTAIEIIQPLAGFVGSDLAVGLLHARADCQGGPTLFIDFGTNSEMALWDGQRFLVTSAAGGPAFEGMGISCGMAAETGAIRHLRKTPDGNWEFDCFGDVAIIGLCAPALVDTLAVLLNTGELNEKGHFREGAVWSIPNTTLKLTSQDVDILQRAKAAIAAGFDFLLTYAKLKADDLTAVLIGGALGRDLSPENAIAIGLLPSVAPDKIHLLGNTALNGCQDWLVSFQAQCTLNTVREHSTVLNLSHYEEFEELFLEHLYLRACAPVDLPAPAPTPSAVSSGGCAVHTQAFCFNAFIHASQYLAALLPEADLNQEATNVAISIFQADCAAMYVVTNAQAQLIYASQPTIFAALEEEIAFSLEQVLESGFLVVDEYQLGIGNTDFIFLPVSHHGNLSRILAVGYTNQEPPSHELLDALLGVAGLLGANLAHQEASAILYHYKEDLEAQVRQRTVELEEARRSAEFANRSKSTFLANMSHELRTPLNAILGFSDILSRDQSTSDRHRETLAIIHKSGDHLLDLINDVLDIAKIEAGRVQLETEAFDLNSLILDVTGMLRIRAQEKGLQLLLDQSPQFPRYIIGDAAKLRQIIINLLSNAVKATEEGGITLRLGVKQTEHLILEVEDTGPGIAPEDQSRIFEAFVQAGSQYKKQGTGLGLAITRQFVELMGGELSLTSVVGQGSIFRVELPVQLACTEDIPAPPIRLGEVTQLAPDQPLWRVLVVEDQLENQLLLRQLLESVGFEVRTADNGVEAIECFQEWQPHFIWMDRRMPVMDGVEATRRIRALSGGEAVKIAAATASTFKEQDAELKEAGFDAIVHKPFRPEQIFSCMEQLLEVRFLHAEAKTEDIIEPSEISATALAALPETLRKELEEALLSLDSDSILNIIDSFAETDAELADALRAHAHHYDYETILKQLQKEGEHARPDEQVKQHF